jgi:hypothetical protein
VNAAQLDWQSKQSACDNFDMTACEKDVKQQQQQQQQAAQQSANNASNGSSNSTGDKRPAAVKDGWHNGIADAQIAGVTHSSDDRNNTSYSPKLVNIADQKRRTINKASFEQQSAWGQAEFFYDCSGDWTGNACNNDEEAMWNFHWRARFRMVNGDAYLGGQAISVADAAMRLKIGVDLATAKAQSWGLTNFVLKAELGKAAADTGKPLTLH